ncbi:hypothetical protein KH5_09520 [Urechidicola sp. KH5]
MIAPNNFLDIEIYFHLGVERTGTKYLQKSIFPFYEGIHFINKDRYHRAKEIITRREYKRYLVSMELNLSPMFEEYVSDFAKNFPHAKCIMVIRRQDEWLLSHYKRIIKNGEQKTFKEFLNLETEESVYKRNDLLYMDKIQILESHFNNKPLYILYDTLDANPIAYLKEIATFVKVPFNPRTVDLKKRHVSYNKKQLKAIKWVRKYVNIDRRKPSNSKVLNLFHRIYVDLIRYIVIYGTYLIPGKASEEKALVSTSELKEIRDFYQKDWEATKNYVKKSKLL